jgi:transcriptional regulator with XRE-family HTH domain
MNVIQIAANLKFLRKRKRLSQQNLADTIGVKRTSYGAYELGIAEPTLASLLKISRFFSIPVDYLLSVELYTLQDAFLRELELGYGKDLSGTQLRVLATTVNQDNIENIEVVPVKAKAGYTAGYADPEYIRVLPTFHMPFLDPNRKYRTFQISGDSMPPVAAGSWVTGTYLQNWNLLSSGKPYIVVLKEEGIVFKIVYNQLEKEGNFLLCSTNTAYPPYTVSPADVLEVWQFVNYISGEL